MKYLCTFLLIITAAFTTGCYDRDILDFKEGESIDPVSNLTHTVNGTAIVFSWELPTSYPEDIIQPVSVYLTVYKNNTQVSTITITNTSTYTYTGYTPTSAYRFIFKVKAAVDTSDPNKSNVRYSGGVVVVL